MAPSSDPENRQTESPVFPVFQPSEANQASRASCVLPYLTDGRFRHVAEILDREPPWLIRKLVPILSHNVHFADEHVREIKETASGARVIYALRYRSFYDLHFLRLRCAALGLPLPAFVFGIPSGGSGSLGKIAQVWKERLFGWISKRGHEPELTADIMREILNRGGAGAIFLVDSEQFSHRYRHPREDPLAILLEVQSGISASIAVIPLCVLFECAPRRDAPPLWEAFLGDPDRPGPIRRIMLASRPWTPPELLVGKPIHLISEFEEFGGQTALDELPSDLRRRLLDDINGHIRMKRGPVKRTRPELIERVLRDEGVQQAIDATSQAPGETYAGARKRAEACVDEIAADPSIQAQHFFYYFLRWLFGKAFEGIDTRPEDWAMLREMSSEGPLILVPCHKSHFDYLLTAWLARVNFMAVPYIGAGDNLSFWPVGPILRKGAAFFLRRSFKGDRLYREVFSSYVKVLVQDGACIKFYLEGGRSRTGKLAPPRVGMLSFLLRTVDEGSVPDLRFVPAFIGYDLNPEERYYLQELAGTEKKKESFLSLLRGRQVLSRKYGTVRVRFCRPVSFNEFRALWAKEHGESADDRQKLVEDFADHLMAGIVRAGVVTAVDLTAAALVCPWKNTVEEEEVVLVAHRLCALLKEDEVETAFDPDQPDAAVKATLGSFVHQGIVDESPTGARPGTRVYVIQQAKRGHLEFYRNALLNYTWPASILALILLQPDLRANTITPDIARDFQGLVGILDRELTVDPLTPLDGVLHRTFRRFQNNGMIPSRSSPADSEEIRALQHWAVLILDVLELYYVLLSALEQITEPTSQKELGKMMVRLAEGRQGKDPDVPRSALSTFAVKNALMRLKELGIVSFEGSRSPVAPIQGATAQAGNLRRLLARTLALGS